MNRMIIAALAASVAAAAAADVNINLSAGQKPIKDMSKAGCNRGIGFNAAMESIWSVGTDDYWFIENREHTATKLREAGANLLRLQCMNSWFRRGVEKDPKKRPSNPKAAFDFYKANGIKVFVCLECGHEDDKNADATVSETLEIIKWIVDNGYKGVVAGFECGNETYGDSRYAQKAAVWKKIIDGGIAIWGKDIQFGINIAEFFELNPDIKHIRDRMMSNQDFKRDWTHAGAYFTAANFNKFSSQFVVKMKEIGALDNVSHVIWHAYGAETPYSCSYHGIQRFRNYVEAFPELKGKQWWLTEIRPRSDEDNQCQRQFREALVMGHYTLTALSQPEVDCFNHHQLTALSGAIYQSDGRKWYVQWYNGSQEELPDFRSGYGKPHIDVGAMGVVYRTLGEGIAECPVFLAHGIGDAKGGDWDWCASARLMDDTYARRRAIHEGRQDVPQVRGDVEWVLATNPGRDKFCLLMVNSKSTPEKVNLTIDEREFAAPTYRTVTCPEEFLDCNEIPGEEKPWRALCWEDTSRGYWTADMSAYEGIKSVATTLPVTIKPHTVQTVTFRTRRAPKRK